MTTHGEYCMYIQKISIELKEEEIINIVEKDIGLGKISKIEVVSKNGKFLSVFIYFSYITWTPKTVEIFTSLYNGHSFKLVLNDGTKWIARQKCVNNTIFEIMTNRISKMEEMIETQNSTIEELKEMVESLVYQERKNNNSNSNSNSNNYDNFGNLFSPKKFYYISDSSSNSSSDSLFSF